MRNSNVVTLNAVTESQVKMGCWGFITGIDIEGTRMVALPDIQVPHYRDLPSGDFIALVRTDTMPAGSFDPMEANQSFADGPGCFGAKICSSNTNIIHFSWNGRLWRATLSADVVTGIVMLNLTQKKMFANSGEARLFNNKMDCSGADANSIIVGTNGDGVWFSTNTNLGGSCTFTAVTGVTAGPNMPTDPPRPFPHLVAWDKGNANYLYYFTEGTGAFRSSTGAVAGGFSAIGGTGPTTCTHMEVLADGTLAIAERSSNKLWLLARGTGNSWTSKTIPGSNFNTFAFDPSNANKLCASLSSGPVCKSEDGGNTWLNGGSWGDGSPGLVQNGSDIPLLAGPYRGGTGGAKIKYDSAGNLWFATGIGTTRSVPPSTAVDWNWYADTKGVEMLGTPKIKSIPGNTRTLFGTYDKGMGRPIDIERYTLVPTYSNPALDATRNIDHCYDIDYATGDPDYVVFAMNYNRALSGYSTNGGKAIQRWATAFQQDPLYGGAVCSTGVGKCIMLPGNNAKGEITVDGGNSWQWLNLPGAGATGSNNFIASLWFKRFPIAADKTRPGHAILYTSTSHTLGAKVFKTNNHGIDGSWTQVYSGLIDASGDTQQYYQGKIEYVPGRAGELLYCCGRDFVNNYLMKSADDGQSWQQVRPSEIRDVRLFGFGTTLSGFTHPITYIYAKVNGVLGFYLSYDWFATTPILMTRFPGKSIAGFQSIEGDKNVPFRCYAGVDTGGAWRISMFDQSAGF